MHNGEHKNISKFKIVLPSKQTDGPNQEASSELVKLSLDWFFGQANLNQKNKIVIFVEQLKEWQTLKQVVELIRSKDTQKNVIIKVIVPSTEHASQDDLVWFKKNGVNLHLDTNGLDETSAQEIHKLMVEKAMEVKRNQEQETKVASTEAPNNVIPLRNEEKAEPEQQVKPGNKTVTVVITANNEGDEVKKTVEDVIENTPDLSEIVLIDDGSSDEACSKDFGPKVKTIRHNERIGIAYSRQEGAEAGQGDCVFFLDAHQRVSKRCFETLREVALDKMAIVSPEIWGMDSGKCRFYGGEFKLRDSGKAGYFTYSAKSKKPKDKLSRCTHLCIPGYGFPKVLLQKLKWVSTLRGWGETEVSLCLKAFFLDINIFNLQGCKAVHMFKGGKGFGYTTPVHLWTVWRNAEILAKTLFDPNTWDNHWNPTFERLSKQRKLYIKDLDDPELCANRDEFLAIKKRPDREFFRGVLGIQEPDCLKNDQIIQSKPEEKGK